MVDLLAFTLYHFDLGNFTYGTETNDQPPYHMYWLAHRPTVAIDYCMELFTNIFAMEQARTSKMRRFTGIEAFGITDGSVMIKRTGGESRWREAKT
jgi:hypothetical protein